MENIRSTGPGRILVIERDLAVSRFVEFVLGNLEAFDVSSEAEPAVALGRAKHEVWDLVLIDFELPGKHAQPSGEAPAGADGWGGTDASPGLDAMGLLATIRAARPGLPIAMMTAFPVTGATADKLRAADGHVTKPITPSHLIGLATGLIECSRRAREQASGY
jgi:CheY-like chemotaxis protein